MSGYILPPAPGVSNDLYLAYPADSPLNSSSDPGSLPSLPTLPNIGSASQPGSPSNILSSAMGGLPNPSFTGGGSGTAASPFTGSVPVSGGSSDLSAYFLRGVVVITGFIFLAAGLSMIRPKMAVAVERMK